MPTDVIPITNRQAPGEDTKPRPGSRADRMTHPAVRDVLRMLAEHNGVCVRPIVLRRTDTDTGRTDIIEVPCGARLASKCKPCAERNRRLRIQQIREGWHLTDEPAVRPNRPGEDLISLVRLRAHLEFDRAAALQASQWDQVADLDAGIDQVDEALATSPMRGNLTPKARGDRPRRKRSTRRRQDTPELPRLPIDNRTVGRVFTGRDGTTHRPSTLLTVTLPSHGAVHTGNRRRRGQLIPCQCGHLHGETDPLLGTPIDPDSYDYRQAALDAIFFARVLDRLWQNLRRAAGYNLQYAGAVELQRRLAPHGHFAIRGTMPRRIVKQVAAATYHQVWRPHFDTPVYTVDRPPVWDVDRKSYVDPRTGQPLQTWDQAVDALDDPDATPAHVARLGSVDPRGITPGTVHADRAVKYVTKYLTKDLIDHARPRSDPQQAHFDRLHAELATLPCSPTCANWLLHGVQPAKARPGLVPGRCSGKVHQRTSLGFTGRRVLISRQWSGKTLADHRADNRAWIRAVLAGTLGDNEDQDHQPTADADQAARRYLFAHVRPDDPDVPPLNQRILRAISERIRWKAALTAARQHPPDPVSATPNQPAAKAA